MNILIGVLIYLLSSFAVVQAAESNKPVCALLGGLSFKTMEERPDFGKRSVRLQCASDLVTMFIKPIDNQLARLTPKENAWIQEETKRIKEIEDDALSLDQRLKFEKSREVKLFRAHRQLSQIRKEIECIRKERNEEASCWGRISDHLDGHYGLNEVLIEFRGSGDFPCYTAGDAFSNLFAFCELKGSHFIEFMSKDILKFVLMPHLLEFGRMSD